MPNRRRRRIEEIGSAGRIAAAIAQHPREFVGILMGTAAVMAIFINALFLQHGPHPAPIFSAHPHLAEPAPVVLPRPRAAEPVPAVAPAAPARTQAQIIGDIQRELARKGFYEGAGDGIWGARTDAAARDFAQAANVKISVEATDTFLSAITASAVTRPQSAAAARNDPLAALIAPSQQMLAVQRSLADYGYGPLKASGVYDPATKAAIEKFERDRRLPVTGVLSADLIRELSAVTGRPLE